MTTSPHLRQLLHDRQRTVVRGWREALLRSGLVALDSAALQQNLDDLAGRVSTLLLVEPFSKGEAQGIGVALARLPSVHPEALGCALDALGQLLAGLPVEDTVSLQPHLMAVLGQIVSGFLREHDEIIREQQHAMHRVLSDAKQQADDARRASEVRYQAVVREATEGIVLVDARTAHIVETNLAFQAMTGYAADDLIGMPLHVIAMERQAMIDEGIRRILRDVRRDVGERPWRRRDGTLVPLEANVTTIRVGHEVLLCIVARDISERRRAEVELDAAHRRVAASREKERSRLARELHDGAVQTLVGLRYQLAAVQRGSLGREPDKSAEKMRRVEAGIAQVVSELRELIGELRPAGLDEGGLIAALENYAGSLPAGAAISMDVSPDVEGLPRPLALCLFRIVQEAVRNALHHGQAQGVTIRLRPRAAGIILRIADNGNGFTVPQPLGTMAQANHFGVLGMIERVGEVQGRLRIRSRAGQGTIVTVWVPHSPGTEGV